MPRFSSVSTISDINTKVVDAGLKLTSSGTTVAARAERVESVTGSSAGAASSEFHAFLQSRKRETDRWNRIEQSAKDEEEQKTFVEKVEKNKLEAEERTRKNAAKRNKKKEMKKAKKNSCSKDDNVDGKEDDDKNDDKDDNKNNDNDDDNNNVHKKQRISDNV